MRHDKRKFDELRKITIEKDVIFNADGSCLFKIGNTHVICTASIENSVPHFLRNSGTGWVTAEYGMLPRSTSSRMKREAKYQQTGRTQEIQRLIGRSLRACVDLKKLGERQIILDCDVINADGGTRTASINGAFIALSIAVNKLLAKNMISENPITDIVSSISAGIYGGSILMDLCYIEDKDAEIDANFVFNGAGNIIEIQSTAEKNSFTQDQFATILSLASQKALEIQNLQKQILS